MCLLCPSFTMGSILNWDQGNILRIALFEWCAFTFFDRLKASFRVRVLSKKYCVALRSGRGSLTNKKKVSLGIFSELIWNQWRCIYGNFFYFHILCFSLDSTIPVLAVQAHLYAWTVKWPCDWKTLQSPINVCRNIFKCALYKTSE